MFVFSLLVFPFVIPSIAMAPCPAVLPVSPHNRTAIKKYLSHGSITRYGVNPAFSFTHTDGFSYVIKLSTLSDRGG